MPGITGTSVTVNALVNGTRYDFTVAAVNAAGEGPPSSPPLTINPMNPTTVLASGLTEPATIAVDATSVYWIDSGNGLTTDGRSLRKIELDGGSIETLAAGLSVQTGLLLDASHVYWSEDMAVKKIAKTGGPVTTLASGKGSVGFAIDDSSAYFSENIAGGSIYAVSLDGGAVTTLATGLVRGARSLAVNATDLVYADYGNNVAKVALEGGTPTPLATGLNEVSGIAIDAASVYWIQSDPTTHGGLVQKVGLDGGTITTLASGQGFSAWSAVALDATHVYWTEIDNHGGSTGAIKKVGKSGGGVTTLAVTKLSSGQGNSYLDFLAVDATSVYWPASPGTINKVH